MYSIEYVHQKIHEGQGFICNYQEEAVTNDGVHDLLFRTQGKAVHMDMYVEVGGKFYLTAYTGSEFATFGTDPDNDTLSLRNCIVGGALPSCLVTSDPTLEVDGLGDAIENFVLVGGTGPQSVGTSARRDFETIIPPNTDLMLRLTNKSGQAKDFNVMVAFYEVGYNAPASVTQLSFTALSVTDVDEVAVTLDPVFASTTYEYDATVEYFVDSIIIEPTVSVEGAYVKGDGTIPLVVGENFIPMSAGKSGYEPVGYDLTVVRKDISVLATMSVSYTVGEGEEAVVTELVTLNPLVFDYSVGVPNTVESVDVVGTVGEGYTLTMSVNVVEGAVALVAGTPSDIVFTVEDDLSVKSDGVYTVTVLRAEA